MEQNINVDIIQDQQILNSYNILKKRLRRCFELSFLLIIIMVIIVEINDDCKLYRIICTIYQIILTICIVLKLMINRNMQIIYTNCHVVCLFCICVSYTSSVLFLTKCTRNSPELIINICSILNMIFVLIVVVKINRLPIINVLTVNNTTQPLIIDYGENIKYEDLQKYNQETCVICIDEFKLDDTINKLKCNHCYHEFCIKEWTKTNPICPICKASLRITTNVHI